jgi:predicted RNA-binding Zn-ribbon protein involved in translation (DUF1610 family)
MIDEKIETEAKLKEALERLWCCDVEVLGREATEHKCPKCGADVLPTDCQVLETILITANFDGVPEVDELVNDHEETCGLKLQSVTHKKEA